MGRLTRLMIRLPLFFGIVIGCQLDWLFRVALAGFRPDRHSGAEWLQRWSRRTLALMGCQVEARGVAPTCGLCVSNHLGYLDILVLSALFPAVFVSKHNVRYWPVFGWLAAMAGTLFVRRDRRGQVAGLGPHMASVLNAGIPLVFFPEGTSSGGESVLPFKSSLFQPAVEHAWPVSPIGIAYHLENGNVAEEIAYWRDMTLVPHLLNLLTKKRLRARVVFGEALPAGRDRKRLCAAAEGAVRLLRQDATVA